MDYKEFIESIPRNRIIEGYSERHHIIPRCLGGTDDEDNLINLTAREHFIAHMLLAKENPSNNKLTFAFHLMSTDGKHDVTPEEYEEARKMHSKSIKGIFIHDTPHTEETRRLISENTKASLAIPEVYMKLVESHRNPSEEIRKKYSDSKKGRILSEKTRKKMSESHLGKRYTTMSEEGRHNISESHKGKVYDYNLTCRLCGNKSIGNNPGIRRCPICKGSGEL